MTRKIVVRASATPAIGAGHLIRCGALGRALSAAGVDVFFAVGPESLGTLPDAYRGDGFEVVDIEEDHAREALAVGEAFGGADAVIVDDYRLGEAFESQCRDWANKVIVLSDLRDKPHDADVLLDASGGCEPMAYKGLVPLGCQFLMGPRYALLRELFQNPPERPTFSDGISRVFISMGATDMDNHSNLAVTSVRKALPDARVDVLLAGTAPHLPSLRGRATEDAALTIHTDLSAEEVVKLLGASDLAIGTGGIGLWERCALGIPSITLVVAANQRANAVVADKAGASIMITDAEMFETTEMEGQLRTLNSDARRRSIMGQKARELCDGKGAARAAADILSFL